MSTTIQVHRDADVQRMVHEELEWTPEVDAAGIGVAVEGGAVTLSGEVATLAERVAATRATLRVRGVAAVVDNLVVHPRSGWPVSEADIAKEVVRALHAAANVPDTVKAEIDGHTVILDGTATWDFQRQAAVRAVQYLRGVGSVVSRIALIARPPALDTEDRIRKALVRNAQVDAERIEVSATGGTVTLTGTVRSWAERRQAEVAAWASPHVAHVENRIVVSA